MAWPMAPLKLLLLLLGPMLLPEYPPALLMGAPVAASLYHSSTLLNTGLLNS